MNHGEVLFALVAVEGLLECLYRLDRAAGGLEDRGEVGEGVALPVEHVGFFTDLDRLSCELLSFGVLAVMGMDECLYLQPDHLEEGVVGCCELATLLSKSLGLVLLSERAELESEPWEDPC